MEAGTATLGSFIQFNDGPGQTALAVENGILGFREVPQSSEITANQSFERTAFPPLRGTLAGFVNEGGDVGWIRFAIGQDDGITFSGAINPDGGPILAGSVEHGPSDVPLPASLPLTALGMLALGAVGLRRRRAKARAGARPGRVCISHRIGVTSSAVESCEEGQHEHGY